MQFKFYISAILVFVFSLVSCSPSPQEPKTVQADRILVGAGKNCPETQNFSLYNEETFISTDSFPNPALFVINKGNGKCANLHNIDHGGVFEWLIVDYNSDCILNGSTWILDTIRVVDKDHMYINLKSIDDNNPTKIFIRSNEGYSLTRLTNLMGIQAYACFR